MSKPSAVVVGVGAERGLGAALCRRFALEGYHVLVAGRTAAKINKVAETIISAGGSAEPIATDATLDQDVVRRRIMHLVVRCAAQGRSCPSSRRRA